MLASAAEAAPALPGDGNDVMLIAMALWSFGTVLIPFTIGLGVHDLLRRREARRYTVGWWSIVFPIGMYATATLKFGTAIGVEEFATIGTAAVWCGGAAWLLVAAGGLARIRLSSSRRSASARGAASTRAAGGGASA